MKINTARNLRIDERIQQHLKDTGGFIDSISLHAQLQAADLLPFDSRGMWCHLDLHKYIAIYWGCCPRLWKAQNENRSAFDTFALRQLKLISESDES